MGQRAPSVAQIAVAVAFAFSCFGLLLFLWSAFGGPVPLRARGLPGQGPVQRGDPARGRVRRPHLRTSPSAASRRSSSRTRARTATSRSRRSRSTTRYAPIPEDTLAMLRQKTLLGETYVELTQGVSGRAEPGGGRLAAAGPGGGVGPARRDLPHLRRAHARVAFQTWMQQAALAIDRPWRRPLGRDRQPRAVRRGRQPAAPRPRHPGRARVTVRQEHRRRLRRALRAPGPAPRPDPELRRRCSRPPRGETRISRDLHRAAHLPRRVARDAEPARDFSRNAEPGDHPAAPCGRELSTTLKTDREDRPRPQGLLRRRPQAREALEDGPARAAQILSTPTCRPC